MHKVVLIRHGQSQWNLENRFTGWTNIDLSEKGKEEALEAAKKLKEAGLIFDKAYTSVLSRAIHTLHIIEDELDLSWIPTEFSWELNERHYGALQGLNKAETAQEYGAEQVHIWRRSYDIQPPAMEKSDERYAGNDPRYSNLPEENIPLTESLKDTCARVIPYWEEKISKDIRDGKEIIIAAHGNSLRALIKHLDGLSDEEIIELELPTGAPIVYELDDDLKPIQHYSL